MPTPSDDALEAIDAIKQRNNGNVILRDYEAVALDEYIQLLQAEALRITELPDFYNVMVLDFLNEARLEGAKAMRQHIKEMHQRPLMGVGEDMWEYDAHLDAAIDALDPQQVINESVKS
jgi:hypothetical protein